MRKQEFCGYLKDYLKEVSGLSSLSIAKLSKALKKNCRIRDALVLYCVLTNKQDRLNKCTKNAYETVFKNVTEKNYLYNYQDFDFKKIHDDYLNKLKYKQNDDYFKEELRKRIVDIMNQKKISKYRVYTDLDLNPGNINDYLKNNNPGKISSSTAKKIYHYVEAF